MNDNTEKQLEITLEMLRSLVLRADGHLRNPDDSELRIRLNQTIDTVLHYLNDVYHERDLTEWLEGKGKK